MDLHMHDHATFAAGTDLLQCHKAHLPQSRCKGSEHKAAAELLCPAMKSSVCAEHAQTAGVNYLLLQ